MTKEEWKKVEGAATSFYSTVHLKADGYDIALVLQRVGPYKNMIMVYVGGEFRGKWLQEDCEERRRFTQKKTHSFLDAKQKAELKDLPKRMQKELAKEHHNFTYDSYSPQWSSFGALKKHLIANNQSIELVKIG